MKIASGFAVLLVGLFMAACDQLPGAGAGGGIAIVDLNAIAKATGRDAAINERMESAGVDLNSELTQIAGDLEQQLKDKQEEVGASPKPAEQQQLQQMAAQAQRQLAEKQQLAQQKAQQFQLQMVNEFKRHVQPVAEQVANKQGADVIVLLDDTILWFDPGANITEAVIAELSANPLPPIQVEIGGSEDSAGEQSVPATQ